MDTTPDGRRALHTMFDAHNTAFAALRRANVAMGEALQAHDDAIAAALVANQAAIDVLTAWESNHPS
jgi:hypothetical protein